MPGVRIMTCHAEETFSLNATLGPHRIPPDAPQEPERMTVVDVLLEVRVQHEARCSHVGPRATLRLQLQPAFRCSSLSTLDPSSGREIPAICHGTGVWHGNFTPES